MTMIQHFVLSLRSADTPFFARLKQAIRRFQRLNLYVPRTVALGMGAVHSAFRASVTASRWILSLIYRQPVFRSMCRSVGRQLYLEQIPYVSGAVDILVGDNVTISGDLSIAAGRTFDRPEVVIGNNVFLGHRLRIVVAKQIRIEDGAGIAAGCYIADNDGHPSDRSLRKSRAATPPEEVKPVRIGRNAWIGQDSCILKGVTIGEGAVIGVRSVVVSDVPSFTIAFGNPARVVRQIGGGR